MPLALGGFFVAAAIGGIKTNPLPQNNRSYNSCVFYFYLPLHNRGRIRAMLKYIN